MDNIGVRITATSDVGAGVSETKAQLGGLEGAVQSLSATFAATGAKIKEAFLGGVAPANQLAAATEKTAAAANEAGASFGRMSERVHMGGLSFGLLEAATGPLIEAMVAVFAVDKIAEWTNKMAEAAEKVQHLSQQFGMSVGQVQQLQGVATATGIPVEALTRGMGLLDRNMATAAAGSKRMQQALNAVGVSLSDGRDQMQKLEVVADKFQRMDDGPKKAALAMQLFGRSGRELIPVLDLGSAGITQLNQKMAEYGVVNEQAVAKGVALAESVNESKLGFAGMMNVLTEALAPALKAVVDGLNSMIQAFIESYNSGGIVYVLFQTISAAIQVVVAVVETLAEVFRAVWDVIVEVITDIAHDIADVFGVSVPGNVNLGKLAMNEFKDVLIIVKDAVLLFVDVVGGAFRALLQVVVTFGKIAYDALTLHWGSIAGDWQTGMDRLATIVHQTAQKVIHDADDMASAIAAAAKGEAFGGTSGGLKLPKAGGDFDFTPSPTGGKNKKEKKPEDDRLSIWRQQLADMLNAEENWGVDENAFSMQFWQHKLDTEKLSGKQILDIRRIIAEEKKAIFKEEQQAEIDSIKKTETIRLDDAKTQISLQKQTLNERLDDINEAEKRGQTSAIKALQQRNQVNQQLLQLDQQEAEEEYQIKLQALQAELALEHLKPAERQKINNEIIVLQRQFYNQMAQLNAQYNAKIKQQNAAVVDAYIAKWKGIVAPVTSALGGMFSALYNRQMTFKQAAIQAMDSIVMSWAQKGIEALGNWIATQLGMRAANTATHAADTAASSTANATKLIDTQITNFGQIMSYVPVASAAAFASTAAIPIVGPILAPPAAAAAGTAVAAMAPMAFAEQGFDVPWGVNPMTQLHQEEMVLPAHLANPLRDLLAQPFMLRGDRGGAAGRAAGETGRTSIDNSQGDTHLHYGPQYHGGREREMSLDEMFERDSGRVIRKLNQWKRDGKIR